MAGIILYCSRDAHKQWCKTWRGRNFQIQSQLLPGGPCTSCTQKRGHRYIPCARQPITDEGAISNLGGLRSARCLMERTERMKKKTDPKRVLVCFQVGAVKAAPNTSLQSRPADLTPVGSDVMTDSQRRESTPSTHP